MLRLVLTRLLIFAAPFVIYFIWREYARRTGRAMGSTPWAWLTAAGAIFAALSLMSGAFWYRGHNENQTYGPQGALPDGRAAPTESTK